MNKDKFICGLDLGTSKITAAIAKERKDSKVDLLATNAFPSKGVDNNGVNNLANLSEAIFELMTGLIKLAGKKIKELHVSVKGQFVGARHTKAMIPLLDKASKVVTSFDIERVKTQARLLGLNLEEDCIHEFTQSYKIDDCDNVINPTGLYGRKLEVDLFLITILTNQAKNLLKAINQAGWEVRKIVFSPLAISTITLDSNDKKNGSVLIDIGAGSTQILVFKDGILREMHSLKISGNDLTESIASKLKIPFNLAEELKVSHGASFLSNIKDEDILVKEKSSYSPIKRKFIVEAIEPKLDELVSLIKESLDKSQFRTTFNSGIVFTGGVSLMEGFLERVESKINLPVRMGKAKGDWLATPKLASNLAPLGLIKFVLESFNYNRSVFDSSKKLITRMADMVKELYLEYF